MPDPKPTADLPVLALIRDLMFSGKVVAEARAVGMPVKVIRDPAKLAGEPGRKLIVDLNLDRAIDAASAWRAAAGGRAIGFVSHVDTATINRARAAGIDRVIAKSEFTRSLASLLQDGPPSDAR